MKEEFDNALPGAKIKVIGIGGGGGNAVNTMIRTDIKGVEFISANTDLQALRSSLAPIKLQVGRELTKGLGAGADPDIGRDAALEDRHAIQNALEGADMVFITAGMGGGTGTGGAAIIAQIAKEIGALTVGVVTKPFHFEGKRRKRHAELGIQRLREQVDTLITIPNQRLLQISSPELSMIDAFRMADDVLVNAVKGISDIINIPGIVNVDFADVKTVMSSMGLALMGTGVGRGPKRAEEAALQAVSSPLLEDVNIEGATGMLVNIVSGKTITLREVNDACTIIQDAAHEEANIIFGAVLDESLGDELRVTVIATGFPSDDHWSHFNESHRAPKTQIRSSFKEEVAKPASLPHINASFEAPKVFQPQAQNDISSLTKLTLNNTPPENTEQSPAPYLNLNLQDWEQELNPSAECLTSEPFGEVKLPVEQKTLLDASHKLREALDKKIDQALERIENESVTLPQRRELPLTDYSSFLSSPAKDLSLG